MAYLDQKHRMESPTLTSGTPETAAQTPLEIIVVFTDANATGAALRTAAQFAQGLSARIRLFAFQCVPYPLDAQHPPVSPRFLDRRFRALIDSSGLGDIDTIVDIQLGRDLRRALQGLLAPRSVVIIGKRTRWWPKPEDRLERHLRRHGHHVIRTAFHKDPHHA